MSLTNGELENLANARADFEMCLSQEQFDDCYAIVENLGDLGYETEAALLMMALRRAEAKANDDVHFEPYEHEIPLMTEAEKRAWTLPEEHVPSGPRLVVSHGESWGEASVSVENHD